jgi:acetyl-CoA carboxylase carboxyltransferase component
VAHYRAASDEACLAQIRKIVSELPRKADPALPLTTPRRPRRTPATIYDILPADEDTPYDLRALLDCLLDEGQWEEYGADRAPGLVTGYARIAGIPVGLIANQRGPGCHDEGEQESDRIGCEVAAKASGFIDDCNRQGTPLVFLQDVSGVTLGRAPERSGGVVAGARLIEAMATAAGPRIVLAVRHPDADDYFAIIAQVFDPDFIFALPTNAAHGVTGTDESPFDVKHAAARGAVDAVIAPEEVRRVLESALRTVLNNPRRHPGLLMLPDG